MGATDMPIVMPPPGDPDGYIFERAALQRLRHFKTLAFERDDARPPLDPSAAPWAVRHGYHWISLRGD